MPINTGHHVTFYPRAGAGPRSARRCGAECLFQRPETVARDALTMQTSEEYSYMVATNNDEVHGMDGKWGGPCPQDRSSHGTASSLRPLPSGRDLVGCIRAERILRGVLLEPRHDSKTAHHELCPPCPPTLIRSWTCVWEVGTAAGGRQEASAGPSVWLLLPGAGPAWQGPRRRDVLWRSQRPVTDSKHHIHTCIG